MTCGHNIHLARQFVLSVFCFVLLYHAFHSLMLHLSLSHSTCLAHLSERKEASPVCYDIKRDGFKEYIDDAFFVCVCVFFLFFVLLLDFFLLEIKFG